MLILLFQNGYKIIYFGIDNMCVDGKILDPVCRNPNNPHHVSDGLLRWHFRQSVLANMRGAGEPIWSMSYVQTCSPKFERGLRHRRGLNWRLRLDCMDFGMVVRRAELVYISRYALFKQKSVVSVLK